MTTGTTVTLQCAVSANAAVDRIIWEKTQGSTTTQLTIDGIKYQSGSVTSPSLVITNANSGDSAQYQCKAVNSAGTGSSGSVTLIVSGGKN